MNESVNNGEDLCLELIELFSQLKKEFREKEEENEEILKEKEYYEQNKEWNSNNLEQFRQQLEEQKALICSQQKMLNKFNELKEDNNRMKTSLLDMNSLLNQKEEEFNNKLETNETEIKRLNDLINKKEVIINELEIKLKQKEFNFFNEMNEMQNNYESKIETLNKDWNEKYNKCLELNDEKIIEIKANCLRTIEKTKEEYESQLIAAKNQNKDLFERYSHLRLEIEARNMSNHFVNQNNNSIAKNKSANVAKVLPNTSTTNQKVSIQVLDSNNDQNEQTVHLIAPKRKKLVQNDNLYLQFLKEKTES